MFRCTPEEIEKIKYLHNQKWNSYQIGREIGKHHTTVLRHLGRIGSGKYDGIGKKPSEIPEFIRENLEAEEVERKNKIESDEGKKKRGHCRVCGNWSTDPKWWETNYCGLKCFSDAICR